VVLYIHRLIVTPQKKLRGHLAFNAIVVAKLLEYLKLVKLVIVMVMGNPEDERTFFIVNFMISKLHNRLVVHLNLAVKIYAQELYKLETFPFYTII
jgi:hypothetical protein